MTARAPRSAVLARVAFALSLSVLLSGMRPARLFAGAEDPWSPGLNDEERALAARLVESTLAIAVTKGGERPGEASATASGFVLREDGLVVTSWRAVSGLTAEHRVWARRPNGAWTIAVPLGGTWWADVAVLRVATTRGLGPAVSFADATKDHLGRRVLTVGAPMGRTRLAVGTEVSAVEWFDPATAGGLVLSTRKRPERAGPKATAVGLRLPASSWLPTAAGTPVFDAEGRCLGMVVAADDGRSEEERTLVRTSTVFAPAAAAIARDTAFDPATLGVRFGPLPAKPGTVVALPPELERVRGKTEGGALVLEVVSVGPANGRLWEGDVVLAVDGRGLFAEIPASFALAFVPIDPGSIVEVTVFRGGRPEAVRVPTVRSRTLDPRFAASHEEAGAALR